MTSQFCDLTSQAVTHEGVIALKVAVRVATHHERNGQAHAKSKSEFWKTPSSNCETFLAERSSKTGRDGALRRPNTAGRLFYSLIPLSAQQFARFFHGCTPDLHHFIVATLIKPAVVAVVEILPH